MKTTFPTYGIAALVALLLIPIDRAASAVPIGEILPLGDSITDGLRGTGGGYRARLYLLLNNAGDSFRMVGSATNNSTTALTSSGQYHHEGHSGYRIDQIEGNLIGEVSSAPAFDTNNGGHWLDGGIPVGRAPFFPDLILLHIGTNDASQGRTAAQMQSSLQSLLTKIKNLRPQAQVIVASLIRRTDNASLEATQMSYNGAIPGLVAAQGANFHFVDMHAIVQPADLADGVHPSQGGYDKMADAWAPAVHAVARVEPLTVTVAASRKLHAPGKLFDMQLPLSGAPGVECRAGGSASTYTLVFTFTNNITSATAAVTSGQGSVSGAPTFFDNIMSIDLTGVADAQTLMITLSNIIDAYSQRLPTASIKIGILAGDTSGNGIVNSTDVSQTKNQSGSAISDANFRADVTVDGSINSSDVGKVKLQSGKAIPAMISGSTGTAGP
jgi:GDSL-like lipase/acylhydrolase family protein/dockerin type I repeat protein